MPMICAMRWAPMTAMRSRPRSAVDIFIALSHGTCCRQKPLFWPRLLPTSHVARASFLMANLFCAGGPDDPSCAFQNARGERNAVDFGRVGAGRALRHRQLRGVARRFQE